MKSSNIVKAANLRGALLIALALIGSNPACAQVFVEGNSLSDRFCATDNDGGRDYAMAILVGGVPDPAITLSGNDVIVSWPANGTCTLLQTTNLAGGIWTTNASFTSTTGVNSVTNTSPTGNVFFRLRSP